MVLFKNLILRNDTLKDIFKECSSEKMDFLINGISSNSKEIKKGYIFVALKGQKLDGKDFILQKLKKMEQH